MRLSFTFLKFGTDGYYAKCWKQDDSGVFLYKGGNTHCEIEPRFEYLVPQLSGYLSFAERSVLPKPASLFEGIGSRDAFRRICVLDAVIMNTNHYYENFGVLFVTILWKSGRWCQYLTTIEACCRS